MLTMTETLSAALCRIDGVLEADSAFKSGTAFWVNGREIAHFEGPDGIDLRLTRAQISARRADLKADPRVTLRPGSSDWLTVRFASASDEEFVCELAEAAAAAHRPVNGSAAKPPPAGADLARRRRFH
jgi:Family of unknown function (DUF5519)